MTDVQKRGEKSGRRWVRYSTEERSRLLDQARQRFQEGASVRVVADELGISYETLRRWRQASSGIKPVRVRRENSSGPTPRSLSLVTGSGVRVEGLSVEEAAQLLRALG